MEQINPTDLEIESERMLVLVEQTSARLEEAYAQLSEPAGLADLERCAASLKRATGNLSKALRQTYTLSDELNARYHDIRKQNQKRRVWSSAPANAVIDRREQETAHFARGLNRYKLLLILFVGSFVGVVVELLWCLLTHGYLESRSGLVYGPFNLLYGVGAVALTVCLYKFRNRGRWISFLGGMIVGSVVEYICSWGQELVFGSRSWDYSHMPFNINGRICLLYSIFWGILGVLWIKDLYPRMAKWILKLPNKSGKILTWVLAVFFVFNSIMTVSALVRWAQRLDGKAPQTVFGAFIDQRFPDDRMETIFANMEFGTGSP